MKKLLHIKWSSIVFCIMIWFFIFAIVYWFTNGNNTFDESGTLYFLMKDWLSIPLLVPFVLLICLLLIPIFLYKLFKNSWVKPRKSFIPIYNVYVLLWIIGVKKRLFSVILLLVFMFISFTFLAWSFSCACICPFWEYNNWYMPRDCGYNVYGWFFNFVSDVLMFIMSLYIILFVVILCYRLFKHYFSQKNKK